MCQLHTLVCPLATPNIRQVLLRQRLPLWTERPWCLHPSTTKTGLSTLVDAAVTIRLTNLDENPEQKSAKQLQAYRHSDPARRSPARRARELVLLPQSSAVGGHGCQQGAVCGLRRGARSRSSARQACFAAEKRRAGTTAWPSPADSIAHLWWRRRDRSWPVVVVSTGSSGSATGRTGCA